MSRLHSGCPGPPDATVKPLAVLSASVPDDAPPDDSFPDDELSDDAPSDAAHPVDSPPDTAPTVSCSRCDRTWELEFELETLHAGNRAIEQFALDHERHVGHFPDDVTPWIADCRRCPQVEPYLEERPARRWAQTHARHARHEVELRPPAADADTEVLSPDDG